MLLGAESVILQGRAGFELEPTTYDLEYFLNRRPFKKAMEQVCDFNYYTTREGSPFSFSGHFVIHYHFSYDMEKLLTNLKELKELLRKTKFYRKVQEIRTFVDKVPDRWQDFNTFSEISNFMNYMIDWCKTDGAASQCFHYTIENDISKNIEFQKHFYAKMTRPMISVVESNGWEREVWRWWLDVPQDKNTIDKLLELCQRFIQLGETDQKIGKTSYHVNLVAKEFADINFDSNRCTYLSANNQASGKVDAKKIDKLIKMNDDDLFQALYKGGIAKIFVKPEVAEHGLADG